MYKAKSVQIHTRCDSPVFVYTSPDFLQQLLRGFRRLKFRGFVVLSSHA